MLTFWEEIDSTGAYLLFSFLSHWPTFLCPAIAPALVAGAISSEREQKCWDLMVLSRLTPAEIIWGKLLSRLMPLVWVTIPFIPVGITLLILSERMGPPGHMTGTWGGFDSGDYALWMILGWMTGLLVAFANGVIALYISLRCSSTRSALLIAYGVAIGAYILITMVIGMLLMFFMIPTFEPMTILSITPSLLWGVTIPAVFLTIMQRRFYRLDARVRAA
ncbi:MAG: hypothetical protein GTO55_10085 [Armatimonadetes bacterium]|nr:hypothetical protein [Armatimonadota bacterium]NIM24590.1 hypothetical protein [Armatimonadota bacterium]NIM68466.1 hypothetical protein [Armatimonadota bacterium]NIO98370.1 hypothetical protein [Armatimonadota bacterium]